MAKSKVGDTRGVAFVDNRLTFVSDSQDVEAIKKHIGREGAEDLDDYDSFFVLEEDGDYTEVWGMPGIIPGYEKDVTRLV